jgi:hypothetical protein
MLTAYAKRLSKSWVRENRVYLRAMKLIQSTEDYIVNVDLKRTTGDIKRPFPTRSPGRRGPSRGRPEHTSSMPRTKAERGVSRTKRRRPVLPSGPILRVSMSEPIDERTFETMRRAVCILCLVILIGSASCFPFTGEIRPGTLTRPTRRQGRNPRLVNRERQKRPPACRRRPGAGNRPEPCRGYGREPISAIQAPTARTSERLTGRGSPAVVCGKHRLGLPEPRGAYQGLDGFPGHRRTSLAILQGRRRLIPRILRAASHQGVTDDGLSRGVLFVFFRHWQQLPRGPYGR